MASIYHVTLLISYYTQQPFMAIIQVNLPLKMEDVVGAKFYCLHTLANGK